MHSPGALLVVTGPEDTAFETRISIFGHDNAGEHGECDDDAGCRKHS
jgi:hypothetical protein